MSNPQAESVIRNIIQEICLECSTKGQTVSETLAAFMVCFLSVIILACWHSLAIDIIYTIISMVWHLCFFLSTGKSCCT